MWIVDALREGTSSLRNRFRSEADIEARAAQADALYDEVLAKHGEYTAWVQESCTEAQERLDDLGRQIEAGLQRCDDIQVELDESWKLNAQVRDQVNTAHAAAQETLRSAKDLPRRLRKALRTGQVSASLDADSGP